MMKSGSQTLDVQRHKHLDSRYETRLMALYPRPDPPFPGRRLLKTPFLRGCDSDDGYREEGWLTSGYRGTMVFRVLDFFPERGKVALLGQISYRPSTDDLQIIDSHS